MSSFLSWGLRGAVLGLIIGLLVVFTSYVQSMTGPAVSAEELAVIVETSRLGDSSPYLPRDTENVLRKVAVAQALAEDMPGANKTIGMISEDPLVQDSVRNEIVDELLKKVAGTEINKEYFGKARKVADTIKNGLIKADALTRIASYQASYDTYANSKKNSLAAFAEATKGEPMSSKRSTSMWLFLWPVGLAVFGFIFGAFFAPGLDGLSGMMGGARPQRASAVAELEEEEQEEDEDEEDEDDAGDDGIFGAEPVVAVAEAPPPEAPPAPAPAPAKAAAPAKPPAPAPAKPQAPAAGQPGSMLQRPAQQAAPKAPQGPGKPTQMAPQAPATKLAPRGAPTQIAPPEDLQQ